MPSYTALDREVALAALGRGLGLRAAGALVGCSHETVRRWAARPPAPGATMGPRRGAGPRPAGREGALDDAERAAYEAAMEENALLKAVLDDLKAEGCVPASTSARRRVELGERLRRATGLPLTRILGFLGLSKSSYEYHRARLGRDRDAWVRGAVREVFSDLGGGRGYRAVWAELRARGLRVSEKVVRRAMRSEGLEPAWRRRRDRPWSSYAGETAPAPPNLPLAPDGTHRFGAARPNELWVTDVTEFRLPSGERCYLSPVVDCFDGRPAAWSVGPRPTARLCASSLEAACATLGPGERPVVHTDRGAPYRSGAWVAACEARGLPRSMSRKGRSGDNARAEGFFGTLKREFFLGRDWGGWSLGDFMGALDRWMAAFRGERRSEALGWETPDGRRRALGYAV